MSNLQQALQDKDFQSANRIDQHRYVSSIDPDYAKASPEDQMAYLNHVTGKPAPTTANNSVENPMRETTENSALSRGASGAWEGVKALAPDLNPAHMLQSSVDVMTGVAPIKAAARGYQEYKQGRDTGQGVIGSLAGAVGSAAGLDTKGIRERALRGDYAGIAGETLPLVAATALGAEAPRIKGIPAAASRILRDPETGRITLTPTSIAERMVPKLPGPELGSPQNPGWVAPLPDRMPKVTPELGSAQNPGFMAKLPTRMPRVVPQPAELGSPQNPGWVAPLPNRMPRIGPSGAGRPLLSGEVASSPNDLISRTRALVKPGEAPSPVDLKRAGDLTQAPLARLRTLAKFGDKLAENEINRRLRNQ